MPAHDPIFGADRETARALIRIGAIGLRPDEPFKLTSGWASPAYIDCRRVISFVPERRHIISRAVDVLAAAGALDGLDAVAGGETAGIPYAAWLAEAIDRPMLYVRKQPKGFGRNARIEGRIEDGQRVLLVEDLATDGASKLSFAAALREAGAVVEHAFVVFFYGIFPGALADLAANGLRLHFLATWADVLAEADASGTFTAADRQALAAFLANPAAWSAQHGGRAT